MKVIILSLILSLPAWAEKASAKPRSASSKTEDIEVSVTANTENDKRTLISCALTNHSKHILASVYIRSKGLCFRFALQDKSGKVIPMEKAWALSHSQPDGFNNSAIDRRSIYDIYIRPEETREFKFYLEEAYGERAKEGIKLEVKWINSDPLPKGYRTLKFDEVAHADGSVTSAYEETNHFPGRRDFMVILPLTEDATASGNEPLSAGPAKSQINPADVPANQTQLQGGEMPDSPSSFDRRWLVLLLIPFVFFGLRAFRSRKES